jgi:hypothetical protein
MHSYAFFPHRAFAAFAAIWERFWGSRAAALAAPPFSPPRRPKATAWGFLAGSGADGWYFATCPVDSSITWYARTFGSRGRFFERSGMIDSSMAGPGPKSSPKNCKLTHYRDFDFNDGHGTLQFFLTGTAEWLGSNAGHTNEFIVAGQHINAATPGPVTFAYTPDVELIIQFRDLTTGTTYFSGPASRNPDGAPHVWTEQNPVPEPTSLVLVGLGLLGLSRLKKKF